MDINLDKAISLDLANFTISGNVSITDLTSSETINIKAGTITGNLTVNTPNATVNNNATVEGTITITDVSSGTWNELVSGNKLIFNAENKTLHIPTNVTVTSLTINKNATVITPKTVQATVAQDVTVTVKANKDDVGTPIKGDNNEKPLTPPEVIPETKHTLTLTGEGLASSPVAGEIADNTEVTITITVPEGKEVDTFTVGGVDKKAEISENKYIFTIKANTEVKVTYKEVVMPETKHTLTLIGEGLTSSPVAGEIADNTEVTITITVPEGKEVDTFTVGEVDKKAEINENKYIFTIKGNTEVKISFKDKMLTLEEAVEAALNYQYEPDYAYKGTPKFENNILTTTYSNKEAAGEDYVEVMNDMARYLGALYRQNNGKTVKSITYKSDKYEWNPSASGNLKGSNWYNEATLISVIVNDFKEATEKPLTKIVVTVSDGVSNVDVTLTFVVPEN